MEGQQDQAAMFRDLMRAVHDLADEWLRGLEQIYKYMACTDAQKFKEEVMTKYFPQSLRDRREVEFLQLKQGNMSIGEYESKFEQLSRYAMYLVDIEPKKARRLELGLRPEVGGIMASHHTTIYSEVLQWAQSIFDRLEIDRMTEKNNESYGKRKWNELIKGNHLDNLRKTIQDRDRDQTNQIKLLNDVLSATRPMVESACLGKTCVIDVVKKVISPQIARHIHLRKIMRNNHATIRCFEKEVIFQKLGKEDFRFCAVRVKSLPGLVSAMKSEKMLKKRFCQGFLVSVYGTHQSELTIGNVPIVRDFIDVFPNDLPDVPPDRQLEFTIDLVPGATPVSKASYRMMPKERQELKIQLLELLDKCYV
ncbi:unnamed protein product [Fraxinus pennsylvanica]|uniref:Retrotransposon gag domain-containing protein n=1 Tax=Fraxinus pennsylvanica TaxID=56036 RepID=A0AAD1ZCY5_9LAMI|nr:unnamed protein product [Fraxinus pennsylvanica]